MKIYISKKIADGVEEEIQTVDSAMPETVLEHTAFYFEKQYIPNYLKKYYYFLSNKERQTIAENTKINKNILLNELKGVEVEHTQLNLEGVIQFRLQHFRNYVDRLVDDQVEQYLYQKDYQNFLDLMKAYIMVQTPKCRVLHIVCDETGQFDLFDEYKNRISKSPVESNRNFQNEEFTAEDILISNIIAVAPEKIILHGINYMKSSELLKTLNYLYEDAIAYCLRCPLCYHEKVNFDRN